MNFIQSNAVWRRGLAPLVVLALLALAGCAQTRQAKVEQQGFFTQSEWDLLEPTDDEENFELIYENPNVDWNDYNAVKIDSVSFWRSTEEQKISAEDEQMILEYFYAALHREFEKLGNVVDVPGPGVVRLRVAITGAEGANVTGRVVTTVVPQLKILSSVGGMASDATVTVGEASIAAKLTDSMNDQLLGAAADRRIGQKAFKGMTDKWSDIKNAIDIWSEKFATDIAERIQAKRSGS